MLENLFTAGLLLGQRNALGRLPTPPASSALPMLIGFALLALVVMALVVGFLHYRQSRQTSVTLNSPSELWAELCRIHHLDKSDSAVLAEMAAALAIAPAASLFVRAELWQLEREQPQLKHLRPQLQRLHSLIFARAEAPPQVVRL